VREEKELRAAWSRASIRQWRQQSVPHSGLREALPAPTVATALATTTGRSPTHGRYKRSEPPEAEFQSAANIRCTRRIEGKCSAKWIGSQVTMNTISLCGSSRHKHQAFTFPGIGGTSSGIFTSPFSKSMGAGEQARL
jgi:hypothetical protein